MEWFESILDEVIVDLVAASIVALVSLIAGAVVSALALDRRYKRQIADLETRLSQPITINNVTTIYQGDKSVYQAVNAVREDATNIYRDDDDDDGDDYDDGADHDDGDIEDQVDEAVYMRTPSATNIAGDVTEIRTLTQAEYDAIAKKGDTTLYLIMDER